MIEELRWGFLSAGGIAHSVAEDFQFAGLKIQAIGARNLNKANAFADKFNIPNRHEGYESLVNDPEVDIVYVSTLLPMHHRDAMLAIDAGKHVLLEKPFTTNAPQAREIREAATRNNVFVMEAMWSRFLPAMDEIFKVINSGMLGDIQLIIADHSQFLTHVPRLTERDLGGGALMDLGIYPVSFAVRAMGIPLQVTAKATLNSDQVDLLTSMIFEYKNGAQANLTTCLSAAGPINAIVMGTKGRIEIDRFFFFQTSFRVYDEKNIEIMNYSKKVDGMGRQFQAVHVEECLKAQLLQSPIMSVDESVAIMDLMDEIRSQIGLVYPTETSALL